MSKLLPRIGQAPVERVQKVDLFKYRLMIPEARNVSLTAKAAEVFQSKNLDVDDFLGSVEFYGLSGTNIVIPFTNNIEVLFVLGVLKDQLSRSTALVTWVDYTGFSGLVDIDEDKGVVYFTLPSGGVVDYPVVSVPIIQSIVKGEGSLEVAYLFSQIYLEDLDSFPETFSARLSGFVDVVGSDGLQGLEEAVDLKDFEGHGNLEARVFNKDKLQDELLNYKGGGFRIPVLVGHTGVSKSSIVQELAERNNMRYYECRLSVMERSDFLGRVSTRGDEVFDYTPPEFFVFCSDEFVDYCKSRLDVISAEVSQLKKGDKRESNLLKMIEFYKHYARDSVLFFDEINRCEDSGVYAALVKLFSDKKLGVTGGKERDEISNKERIASGKQFSTYTYKKHCLMIGAMNSDRVPLALSKKVRDEMREKGYELCEVEPDMDKKEDSVNYSGIVPIHSDASFLNRLHLIFLSSALMRDGWMDWGKRSCRVGVMNSTGDGYDYASVVDESGGTHTNIHKEVISYLESEEGKQDYYREDLLSLSAESSQDELKNFPTFRTWEYVSKYLRSIDVRGGNGFYSELVVGLIGDEVGKRFSSHLVSKGYKKLKLDKSREYEVFLEEYVLAGVPFLCAGPTSQGKTSRVEAFVDAHDEYEFVNVNLTEVTSAEISGALMDVSPGMRMKSLLEACGVDGGNPDAVREAELFGNAFFRWSGRLSHSATREQITKAMKSGKKILFCFDEFNKAGDLAVREATMQAISTGQLFGIDFSGHPCAFVLTINYGSEYAESMALDPMAIARVGVLFKKSIDLGDIKSWKQFLLSEKSGLREEGVGNSPVSGWKSHFGKALYETEDQVLLDLLNGKHSTEYNFALDGSGRNIVDYYSTRGFMNLELLHRKGMSYSEGEFGGKVSTLWIPIKADQKRFESLLGGQLGFRKEELKNELFDSFFGNVDEEIRFFFIRIISRLLFMLDKGILASIRMPEKKVDEKGYAEYDLFFRRAKQLVDFLSTDDYKTWKEDYRKKVFELLFEPVLVSLSSFYVVDRKHETFLKDSFSRNGFPDEWWNAKLLDAELSVTEAMEEREGSDLGAALSSDKLAMEWSRRTQIDKVRFDPMTIVDRWWAEPNGREMVPESVIVEALDKTVELLERSKATDLSSHFIKKIFNWIIHQKREDVTDGWIVAFLGSKLAGKDIFTVIKNDYTLRIHEKEKQAKKVCVTPKSVGKNAIF